MDKNERNGYQSAILDFISAKFVMCYPCVTPNTLFKITTLALMQGLKMLGQLPF